MDDGFSVFSVLLFLVNIFCPFLSVAIIRHLKHQYAMETSILNWINLELIICVTLLRPFVFLANKLGNASFDECLTKSNVQLYRSSSSTEMYESDLLERIERLEARIHYLENITTTSPKDLLPSPSLSVAASSPSNSLYSSTVVRNQKQKRRGFIHGLIYWYFYILAFLFRCFVPFSSAIVKFFSKQKTE